MALYATDPNHRTLAPINLTGLGDIGKPYRAEINVQVLAQTHFDEGRYALALCVYHEQIRLFGRNAKILFNIGQIHMKLGELEESASWFKKATILDASFAVAYFQRGAVHALLEDIQKAKIDYDCCLKEGMGYGELKPGVFSEGYGDIGYDQVGMQYILRMEDVKGNRYLCTNTSTARGAPNSLRECNTERNLREQGIHKRQGPTPRKIVSVPEKTIFRVAEWKERARLADPAKTAEWRFRDEARVVAIGEDPG